MDINLGSVIQTRPIAYTLLGMGFVAFLAAFQIPGLGDTQRYTLQAFGGVLLVTGLGAHALKRFGVRSTPVNAENESPPHQPSPGGAFLALDGAIRTLLAQFADTSIVRSELEFEVNLAGYTVSNTTNHGRVETATVELNVSFKAENHASRHATIKFEAGFETSALNSDADHPGSLEIIKTLAGGKQEADCRAIIFKADPGRPIARVYEYTVDLPAKAHARVRWSASYIVDLPYGEYWASSTPTFGMRVEVVEALDVPFAVTADGYGGEPQSFMRHPPRFTAGSCAVRRHVFEQLGPLLPYQGIFLRMRPTAPVEGQAQ